MKPLSLAGAVESYLRHRRQLGFVLKEDGWLLHGLVRYAAQHHHRGALTAKLVLGWAQAPTQASPLWWARRLEAARRFAVFWKAFDPRTQLPPPGVFGPSGRRRPVHLYSAQDLRLLLQAAGRLGGLRAATFQTLLGLLACTGIRIGEALRLRAHDIDWTAATLTIHRSKYGRSRCLPLHKSALAALECYRKRRQRHRKIDPSIFFLGRNGRALSYRTAAYTFRLLCQQLGWCRRPIPRLHDLRHSFAVSCLTDWYRRGDDINQKILSLTTYLGHRNIVHTYWYLSATPQLLALAHGRWPQLKSAAGGSRA